MATTSAAAANPPAEIIELTYGPLVTGIWIQQLLFGYILAQMVDYYRMQWKADSVLNRTIVTTLLVLNTVLGGTDLYVTVDCSRKSLSLPLLQPCPISVLSFVLRAIRILRSARMDDVHGAGLDGYRRVRRANLLLSEVRRFLVNECHRRSHCSRPRSPSDVTALQKTRR